MKRWQGFIPDKMDGIWPAMHTVVADTEATARERFKEATGAEPLSLHETGWPERAGLFVVWGKR